MSLALLLTVFVVYTILFFIISWYTSRKADNSSYFQGNRKSPWFVVAYGMVGTSLSGVTMISVPGNVMNQSFFYMPMVLGFVVGYVVVAFVLLPLYYRMNLVSIYSYLESRFGFFTYKTGASFFLLSRILGAAVRIYLVVFVLHGLLPAGTIPFWVVALIFMVLIYLYTLKGGVKTIVWTDMLQTTFMILAVIVAVVVIAKQMGWNLNGMIAAVTSSHYSSWFDFNWDHSTYFVKQFVSGIFVTIVMTGLDQEMMQKNLSCKTVKDSQKNMMTTSFTIVIVNLLFLTLGAVLALYVKQHGGMAAMGISAVDQIFPAIATSYLGVVAGVIFLIGLVSSSYPSAGGALTSLTTSWCVDFVGFNRRTDLTEKRKITIRYRTHAIYSIVFFLLILVFYVLNDEAVINLVYQLASYTYGPLLGFFFFGILTRYQVRDRWMPFVAILSPAFCFLLDTLSNLFFHFGFGFTLLIVNGLFTFIGMWLLRKPAIQSINAVTE
ncbi:sodium:solute symporter [Microbacter margulisiae]|uniref:Na+/proline symporter n=1 Tax=Microbacter margulisiae TaxID=1350067 RepID=A0A7W5DSZ4_9PORP|nr:sodium:solute symporter [Microbacter margulisiae]MBB3188205.1 Na+/proline symporter [Microbacter margulisiae]